MTLAEKLIARSADAAGGCRVWTGSKNDKGYGTLSYAAVRLYAHRAAYEVFVGPIPAGLVIDHLCRTPACINPDHLEPVTNAENIRRGYEAKNQTHCKRGHDLAEHARINKSGSRDCRACARIRNAEKRKTPEHREYQARWAREKNRKRRELVGGEK